VCGDSVREGESECECEGGKGLLHKRRSPDVPLVTTSSLRRNAENASSFLR
jgi:hypothetical protein